LRTRSGLLFLNDICGAWENLGQEETP
jgi:hypothetical protein